MTGHLVNGLDTNITPTHNNDIVHLSEPGRPKNPGQGDRLPEADPEQGHATGRVEVHQLENVHTSLKGQRDIYILIDPMTCVTCVHMGSPAQKLRTQTRTANFLR